MNQNIQELLTKLNIKPNNYSIYLEALTHKSYAFTNNLNYNYERLEFLGDSIIGKIVSEYLFQKTPTLDEGEMTKAKIMIVQGNTEILAAEMLGIDKCILFGDSMKNEISPGSKKTYEDCYEAFIGAVYLDQGHEKAFEIIKNSIIYLYENSELNNSIDYKSLFQEAVQKFGKKSISYKLVSQENNRFYVDLWCNNIKYGQGYGPKIKDAEKNAAMDAYNKLIKKVK